MRVLFSYCTYVSTYVILLFRGVVFSGIPRINYNNYFFLFGKLIIGRLFRLDKGNIFRIAQNCTLKIGDHCNFGFYNHISCSDDIMIGDNVLIGSYVTIVNSSHGRVCMKDLLIPPIERSIVSMGKITIEKNVWIGDKASIIGGVTIGEGSVVGANTVVTKDVPPYSLVKGINSIIPIEW